jgi:RHS repeat-associated protein
MQYLINAANEVKRFDYNGALNDATSTDLYNFAQNSTNNTYDAGTLYVMVSKDNDGKEVREYKDKNGRVVMKRVVNESLTTNDDGLTGKYHDTYYVYDDLGQLRAVIPPQLTADYSVANVKKYAFCYLYDDRGRMVAKKIPGTLDNGGEVFYVYDDWNRLVATQDAKQRLELQHWTYTKYDELNRPVITGICKVLNNTATTDIRLALQAVVTANTSGANNTEGNRVAIRSGAGYTHNNIFPKGNVISLTSSTVYAVDENISEASYMNLSFFDSYDGFTGGNWDYVQSQGDFTGLPSNQLQDVTKLLGLATASKTRVLKTVNLLSETTPILLGSKVFYDKDFQSVQTVRDLFAKSNSGTQYLERTSKKYLYENLTVISEDFTIQNAGTIARYIHHWFTYDASDHLQFVEQSTSKTVKIRTSALTYYPNGAIYQKKTHGKEIMPNCWVYANETMYCYNMKGNMLEQGSDLFKLQVAYNKPSNLTPALFNGNIAEMFWTRFEKGSDGKPKKTSDGLKYALETDKVGYHFSYDGMNRLLDATGLNKNPLGGVSVNTYLTAEILRMDGSGNAVETGGSPAYDKNGNIMALLRKTEAGTLIDNLKYTYNGNQLLKVDDGSDKTKGFKEIATATGTDYTYDQNGNQKTDENKGISSTLYDPLNLVTQVSINGKTITYAHDANGTKRSNQTGGDPVRYYEGAFEWKNDQALRISTDGGQLVSTDGENYKYQYTLTDHLGDVRVVFEVAEKATPTQVTDVWDITIAQENEYYAFGLLMNRTQSDNNSDTKNRYLYNGKELQDDTEWEDYGWRMYSPEIGRWFNTDPKGEDAGQESWSNYDYGFDDPVRHNDPDGGLPHIIVGAIVGGVIGGAIELGTQLYKGEPVNLRAVAGATVRGAIVGGTAAATGGLSLGVVALGGAAGNVVGGALDNKIQGKAITSESIAKDAISGGLSAAGGAIAGKFINSNVTAKITTPQSGYVTSHTLEGGKVVFSKGLSNSGTSDFVISKAGKITIGSGHWFMSGGSKVVQGAGTLTLKNGKIDAISNWSGHYKPTAAQLSETVRFLKKAGYTFTDNFQKLISK